MRGLSLITSLVSLAFLAACTQEPAELVDKGDEYYGHESSTGTHVAVESNGYQESASVSSVGVIDLKPVSSTAVASSAPAPTSSSSSFFNLHGFSKPESKMAFIWPVEGGHVIAHFSSSNDGISIAAGEGSPIRAAAAGTVAYAGSELKEYGNMVIIRHADGFMTAYAHASSLTVKKHDAVKQGDIVAYVGKTGSVKEAQLHFGIRSGKQPVDPEQYLPKSVANN